MRFFTASCDSSWDGPTPEPAKCPFTNPYGVFYTGKSERDEVEARDDGYMMFTRRSDTEGSGQRRVEAGADNQEVDENGMGGLGRGMVVAIQDGMRDSRQSGSQEPLLAINALLDASYSQGFTDASLLPPPYEVRNSPSRWDSVLSPSLCAFAAKYPMVTIAGLGAVSAATFLGAAGLTGIALRRLGSAPITRGRGIEGRLDDLERRLAQGIASANVQRRSELEGLKKELLSIRRTNGKSDMSLPNGKVDLAAAKAVISSSAPIAPGIEEARLSQVITEAVEAVLAARQPAAARQTTSAPVAGTTKDGLTETGVMEEILASADDHAEALSDKLDEILDAIERLQSSTRALDVRTADLPKTGVDGHPVMSVDDLAKAVQGVKEEFKAAHPAGEPAETLVKELETAAESVEPRSKPLAPEIHKGKALESPEGAKIAASAPASAASQDQRTGGKTFTTGTPYPSGDERARLLKEAASAANRAHTERHEATEHCNEAERQSRNHEREAMVAKMRKAAEDNARRMKELAGKTWGLAGQAKRATEEVVEAADEVKAEAESLAAKSKVIKDNLKTDAEAEGDNAGRIEGIKGSESAAKSGGPLADVGGASATSEPVKTDTSPKTESSTPQPARPKVLYGVDDSGDWSFSLFNAAPERGWHEVPIVLRRTSSAHSYERGLFWRHYSDQRSHAAYSTKAKIYFYPEANMIELDGAMWRCGREGDKYVIRENISKRAE